MTHGLQVQAEPVKPSSAVSGIFYRPSDPVKRLSTGLIVMHESGDFTHHFACAGLASRGYQVLCANTRYVNVQATIVWDNVALDVKASMDFIRKQAGVKKVVLFGHSGGGGVMSWYENVAENGVQVCQGSNKLTPCSNALAGMTPADAMVFLDPIPGNPFTRLVAFDPAVTAEDQFGRIDASKIDPKLDMFSPANGYSAQTPKYTSQFATRFYAGQAARMERLITLAQTRLAVIKTGKGLYPDNEPFIVGRQAAQLHSFDGQVLSHTKLPHTLLTPQGPRETNVKSIRPVGVSVVGGSLATADGRYGQAQTNAGAFKSDVRAFLSSGAIHVAKDFNISADDITGVDWHSANDSTPGNLQSIHVPLLILSATGHYWVVPSEISYNMAGSADKSLAYVFGATHGFTPCKACGVPTSQIGDPMNTTLDYVVQWLQKHFPAA